MYIRVKFRDRYIHPPGSTEFVGLSCGCFYTISTCRPIQSPPGLEFCTKEHACEKHLGYTFTLEQLLYLLVDIVVERIEQEWRKEWD